MEVPQDSGIPKTLLVAGDGESGKTSLIYRYIRKSFRDPSSEPSTVGVDFYNCDVMLNLETAGPSIGPSIGPSSDLGAAAATESTEVEEKHSSKRFKLKIWDSGRRERFTEPITQRYYRNIGAIMIVYDSTSFKSWEFARNQVDEVEAYAKPGIPKILVAAKCDLETFIDSKYAESFATEHGMQFFETSSKTGMNVEAAFDFLVKWAKSDDELAEAEPRQEDDSYCRIL